MEVKKIREIEVSPPWAGFIFDGTKKFEIRKNNPTNWGAVKAGETLLVKEKSTDRKALFTVSKVETFKSLTECYVALGVSNILPGKKTAEEANEVYFGFDGADIEAIWARQKEFDQYGVIALGLTPLIVTDTDGSVESNGYVQWDHHVTSYVP